MGVRPTSKFCKFSNHIDNILFYGKGLGTKYFQQYTPHLESYLKRYRENDDDGKGPYSLSSMNNIGRFDKNKFYEFQGTYPPPAGWLFKKETMQKMWDEGLIVKLPTRNRLYYKSYLKNNKGSPIKNYWDDISSRHGVLANKKYDSTDEKTNRYPTQKPVKLLERIILSSSEEGDTVADFFCGSGTTLIAAEQLKRKWIGCDKEKIAIQVAQKRMKNEAGTKIKPCLI